MVDIRITRTPQPKAKPSDESTLGFGRLFTDHMFMQEYDEGKAGTMRALPYGLLTLDLRAALHYGQTTLKA